MADNSEEKILSLDDLENIAAGVLPPRPINCERGEHAWEFAGPTRPATNGADLQPDIQIKCGRCGKTGWKIMDKDRAWHIYPDE